MGTLHVKFLFVSIFYWFSNRPSDQTVSDQDVLQLVLVILRSVNLCCSFCLSLFSLFDLSGHFQSKNTYNCVLSLRASYLEMWRFVFFALNSVLLCYWANLRFRPQPWPRPFLCVSISLSIRLSVSLSVRLPVCLDVFPSACLSDRIFRTGRTLAKIKNEVNRFWHLPWNDVTAKIVISDLHPLFQGHTF